MKIKVGDFVNYKPENELGLVGAVDGEIIRCWFHMGGTKALVNPNDIELLTIGQAMGGEFSNEHIKASLAERALRLAEGEDVSDLIDEFDIRRDIVQMLNSTNK